jgi:hypothetical protein
MAINSYSIRGYSWLFVVILLVIIKLMVIGDYSINGYWWLFY